MRDGLSPSAAGRRVVIGVGNDLRGDDAAGLAVVRLLAARLPEGTASLHEHGGDGLGLLVLWRAGDDVVVVDALLSDGAPGRVVEVDATEGPVPADVVWPTTHAAGVAEGIEMARAIDALPRRLRLVGITAGAFELGAPMQDAVSRAVEEVAGALEAELQAGHGSGPGGVS